MVKPDRITKKILKERDTFLAKFDDLEGRDLWVACRDDPAVFAKHMLGITLYGWQWKVTRQLVKGDKRVILNTSRQIGKSFLVSVIALWYVVFNKGRSSQFMNTKVGIISATEGQAKKLLLDVKNLMRVGNAHCKVKYSKIPEDVFAHGLFDAMIDNSKNAANSSSCITFVPYDEKLGIFLEGSTIGSFVKSLPPTDIVRGETFDVVIVDEASKVDDEIYNMAISKTGDKYNAMRFITSTPFGRSGFYYEYFDPDNRLSARSWKRFWFTVDAIKLDDPDDYGRRLQDIKEQNELGKNLTVRQEYYGDFVQSEQSFFNPKKVDKIFDSTIGQIESYGGECDMGLDFGGLKKSKTVLTISHLTENGEIRRLWHHAYNVREDASVLEDVAELKNRFNIQRIVVDDCPEGDYKIREMEDRGWDVTRMQFARDKVRKYGDFRSLLNREEILSYPDSELAGEMKALSVAKGRERTKIQPPPGYGDDLIDSFVMSAYHYSEQDDGFNFYDIDDYD